MHAMVLERYREKLVYQSLPKPVPERRQILIQVNACGICRTDLHVVDGELTAARLPLVPGHQIAGTVVGKSEEAREFALGERVGVPWLGGSCGSCVFCLTGRENLCDDACFTGYQINGGFAEYCVADERYCFSLPDGYSDLEAAPLLCAGIIGYRALQKAGEAEVLGLYGFGAAAHILAQVAIAQGRTVHAFTRPGDQAAAQAARDLGVAFAGSSEERGPKCLDAAIIFAPVGALVPLALQNTVKGGKVVCAGIHMSDIPGFPYASLWGERSLTSVANLTRKDGEAFLALAPTVPVRTKVTVYSLQEANEALSDLRSGVFSGSGVIQP